MVIVKRASDINFLVTEEKNKGKKIGFVPTMGALHEGHLSLIKCAKKQNDLTICSIFINPAQFNNQSDFDKYPVTISEDIYLLESSGCDVLFLPPLEEIYPENYITETYELGALESVLEGQYRPGHFQGVCKVVERLLKIIPCDSIYLGNKDYQQCRVIARMIELKKIETSIIICPTVREEHGLAMSSRNTRLSKEERNLAGAIFETLSYFKKNMQVSSLEQLKKFGADFLASKGCSIEYIEFASKDLTLLKTREGEKTVTALIAVYINEVRLIDNMDMNEE